LFPFGLVRAISRYHANVLFLHVHGEEDMERLPFAMAVQEVARKLLVIRICLKELERFNGVQYCLPLDESSFEAHGYVIRPVNPT